MDAIDRQASQIICENVQIPNGTGSHPHTLKLVLIVLRGAAVPGEPIQYEQAVLVEKTQLSPRGLEKCISALKALGFIEQVGKPAPGRCAAFQLNHEAMIPMVPDAALERAEKRVQGIRAIKTGAQRAGELAHSVRGSEPATGAPRAGEQAHGVRVSESTPAPRAPTGAPRALTGAQRSGDLKEETAIPAKPAAAAEPARSLTAEQLLENAAAAAAVMELDHWVNIASVAGIERDLRAPLGRILIDRGVVLAEQGLSVLERLSELIDAGGVKKPSGMLVKLLESSEAGPESQRTERRHRRRKHARDEFAKWLIGLTALEQNLIMQKTRALIEGQLGIEAARELMPKSAFRRRVRDWPAMLDFMLVNAQELGIRLPGEAAA